MIGRNCGNCRHQKIALLVDGQSLRGLFNGYKSESGCGGVCC